MSGRLRASQERASRGSLGLGRRRRRPAARRTRTRRTAGRRCRRTRRAATKQGAHPEHGQPEVAGESARDAAEHPPLGAAVELAHTGAAGSGGARKDAPETPPDGPGGGLLADIPPIVTQARPAGHQGRTPRDAPRTPGSPGAGIRVVPGSARVPEGAAGTATMVAMTDEPTDASDARDPHRDREQDEGGSAAGPRRPWAGPGILQRQRPAAPRAQRPPAPPGPRARPGVRHRAARRPGTGPTSGRTRVRKRAGPGAPEPPTATAAATATGAEPGDEKPRCAAAPEGPRAGRRLPRRRAATSTSTRSSSASCSPCWR